MLRRFPTSAPVGVLLVILSASLAGNFDSGLLEAAQNPGPDKTPPALHITVLEGEDGANVLKSKMAVKPVVEVRDKNNLPVSGATVAFIAPDSGPRVVFAHGNSTYLTTTDANGRAVVHNAKPVGKGTFHIRVQAGFQGHTVTAAITQTNFLTAAAATAGGATAGGVAAGAGGAAAGTGAAVGGLSGALIGGIVAGAAAVAVGVAVGVTRGSKPTGTIGSAGSPSLSHP
jgi:hypothetical protein